MKNKKSIFKTLSLVSQLGFSMIAPIVICVWFGVWLEKKIDFPFTIIMIIVGILAGARNVYALAMQVTKEIVDEKGNEDEE